MYESIEKRWYRWDKMMNQERYLEVIEEFDSMIAKGHTLTIGDLVRRDQSLQEINVVSLNPNNMYNKKDKKCQM